MVHKKYESIQRGNKTGINEITEYLEKLGYFLKINNLEDEDFVVLEKVHGCNLSMYHNGADFKAAKRTEFLPTGDDFMGGSWEVQLEKHKKFLEYLYNFYKQEIKVVGELAGGIYKGFTELGSYPIQSEIEYTPFNFYYIFDIFVGGVELTYSEFVIRCLDFNIANTSKVLFSKALFIGNFESVKNLSSDDTFSTVPQELKVDKNSTVKVEGFVIKTMNKVKYNNKLIRFKILSKDFDESKGKEVAKPKDNTLIELDMLVDNLTKNVTEIHVNKIHGNFGFGLLEENSVRYSALLTEDILKDYLNSESTIREWYEKLSSGNKKYLKRGLKGRMLDFYKDFLNNK